MGITYCARSVPAYGTRVKVNMCVADRLLLPEVSMLSEKAIKFVYFGCFPSLLVD